MGMMGDRWKVPITGGKTKPMPRPKPEPVPGDKGGKK